MRTRALLTTIFAAGPLVIGAALSALGACSTSDGVTPDCKFNVGANGIDPVSNGCDGFAPCLDANGNVRPAAECCVDAGDMASCLYGYGAGPPPTSSSSSSGGGAGGGDAGSGDAGS